MPISAEEQSLTFSIDEQIFAIKVVNKTAVAAQLANCIMLHILIYLGLGLHLFVKVPQPGASEVTFLVFESSWHLLLPV